MQASQPPSALAAQTARAGAGFSSPRLVRTSGYGLVSSTDRPSVRSYLDQRSSTPVSRSRRSKLPRSPLSFSIVWTSSDSRVAGSTGLPCSRQPWTPVDHVDFEAGVIRVERSWDPVKGPIDVKTGAGRRAVPMAFVVRRKLMAHKQRTKRDSADLVFGSHRDRGVLRLHHPRPGEQSLARSRPRNHHAPRSQTVRDLLLHCRRPRLEADLDVGRTRRRETDLEPLRPPRPGRRRRSQRAPRRLPERTHDHPHCGARPQQRRNPRELGASEVPLPGFETTCAIFTQPDSPCKSEDSLCLKTALVGLVTAGNQGSTMAYLWRARRQPRRAHRALAYVNHCPSSATSCIGTR